MNLAYRFSVVTLLSSIFFTACQKNNIIPEETTSDELLRAAENKGCAVIEFRCLYGAPGDLQQQVVYNKSFNEKGKVERITAAIFSGGVITSTATYVINWKKNQLAVVREGSSDTLLVAVMNQRGRVTATRDGNKPDFEYLPTTFDYSNNRVATMKIHFMGKELVSNFTYNEGNITKIDDMGDGEYAPGKIEYQYATGRKIKQQQYFDEPRKFSWNTFTLLQFIGMFPELDGENLRTRTTVDWGNHYVAYDRVLVNHQVDQNGRLMQYAVSDPADGVVSMRYFLDWSCSVASSATANVEEDN